MTKALKKGFTLVELIVVIAIVAILSTVSIVGYNVFVDNANRSKAEQEIAQVESVLRGVAISEKEVKVDFEGDEFDVLITLENNQIKLEFSEDLNTEDGLQAVVNAILASLQLNQFVDGIELEVDGTSSTLTRIVENQSASITVAVELAA